MSHLKRVSSVIGVALGVGISIFVGSGLVRSLVLAQNGPLPDANRSTPLQVYPQIKTDRAEALYKCEEKAEFKIAFTGKDVDDPDWEALYELSKDGYGKIESGKVPRSGGTVGATLTEPGFLRCRLILTWKKGRVTEEFVAVGFEPHKLEPSLPVPDDFEAFWDRQKKALREKAAKPKFTSLKSPDAAIECWGVEVALPIGRPLTGYLARPKDTAAKSLPAVLVIDGSYFRDAQLKEAVTQAKRGRVALHMNPHGGPLGRPQAEYDKCVLPSGDLHTWPQDGISDREKAYYRPMVLRVVQGLDVLAADSAWDGKRLGVLGASLGGGLAIIAGGLDHRVSFVGSAIPSLCDCSGYTSKRQPGWNIVPYDRTFGPDQTILKTMRYFDAVNFATRVKAETVVSCGLHDINCPPTSIHVMYNALGAKKAMIRDPEMGHDHPDTMAKAFEAAMIKAFARVK